MPKTPEGPSPATPFFLQILEQNNIAIGQSKRHEPSLSHTERIKFKEKVLGSPEKINEFLQKATNVIFSTKSEDNTPLTMSALPEYQALLPEQQIQARAAVSVIWQEVLEDWVYLRDHRGAGFNMRPEKDAINVASQTKNIGKFWTNIHIPQVLEALTERSDSDTRLYWTMDFPVKDFVYQYLDNIYDLHLWTAVAAYGDQSVNQIANGINQLRQLLKPEQDMPPQAFNSVDVGLRATLPGRKYRGTGHAPPRRVTKGRGSWYYELDVIGEFHTERKPTPPQQVTDPLRRDRRIHIEEPPQK